LFLNRNVEDLEHLYQELVKQAKRKVMTLEILKIDRRTMRRDVGIRH
jgi:hypothetical protein